MSMSFSSSSSSTIRSLYQRSPRVVPWMLRPRKRPLWSTSASRLARVKRVFLTPVSKALAKQLKFPRWYYPQSVAALMHADAHPPSRHDKGEDASTRLVASRTLRSTTLVRPSASWRTAWRTTWRSNLANKNSFINITTKRKSVSEHWWEQLQTVPNLLTLSRIGVAPVIAYWIISEQVPLAGAACVVAAVTDVLDGWIAKSWPQTQQTVLGTYLDPLADKILINTTATSLWYTGVLPTPLVVLWWSKDIILVWATYIYVAQRTPDAQTVWSVMDPVRTPLRVSPTWTSKLNTGLQFVTLATGLAYGAGSPLVTALCGATAVTTVASVASYWNYGAFQPSNKKKRTTT